MNRFANTDLEGCLKELAERLSRDLAGMTPLEKNEYFLCQSIEHLARVDTLKAATAVIGIAHYLQKKSLRSGGRLRSRTQTDAEPSRSGENALAFRKSP